MCPSRQVRFEPAKFTDFIVGTVSVKENGMVKGIKSDREIQEGEGCDRPFSHVEKKIVLNKEGSFRRMMFSIS